jgi:hypothetical protein
LYPRIGAPFSRSGSLFLWLSRLFSVFGRKGTKVKDYSYKDPYEGPQFFAAIEDDDAKSWNIALAWLEENRKEIQSEDRRQRYNAPYHIEARKYEGKDYASPEDVLERHCLEEDEERIDSWLRMNLTPVQCRRFRMRMDGMKLRDIARLENADYSSVRECIESARKKLRKLYENTPSKTLSKSPYSEG